MSGAVVRDGTAVQDAVAVRGAPCVVVRSRCTRHDHVAVRVHDVSRRDGRRGHRGTGQILDHVGAQRIRRPQLQHVTPCVQQVDLCLVLGGLGHLHRVAYPVKGHGAIVAAQLLFLAVENAGTTHTRRIQLRDQRDVDGLAVFGRHFVLSHEDRSGLAAHVIHKATFADIFSEVFT